MSCKVLPNQMSTYTSCFSWLFFSGVFIAFVFEAENVDALSFKLYHRDTFHNPKISKTEIIRRALTRSLNMSHTIELNSPMSKLINKESVYMMKLRIGTPPEDVFAVMDTSSDMTWIQCEPCLNCLPQETRLFKPHDSSSYVKISCSDDNPCPTGSMSECHEDGFCHHDIRDDEGVYSKGFLSKDTLTMGSTIFYKLVKIHDFTFGCGTDNGSPKPTIVSAVVGLGGGPQSFVSQLGSRNMHKFAYCLIPYGSSKEESHIHFDESYKVYHHQGTVTLPLVNKQPSNAYYLTLEAFTVGTTRVEFAGESGTIEQGNIIIDSGSIFTTLPWNFYLRFKKAVIDETNIPPMPHYFQTIDLCFEKNATLQLPTIVANFRGGDVKLKQHNTYVTMGSSRECLAFRGDSTTSMVYGNLAQQDFILGFDKNSQTISITDFDCRKF